MQLKLQDLQTFEAFRKASRTAASSIKADTPFCIFSDVELPDASKKMRKLRPFLVVGSPANVITPLLKDLHGNKKFVAGGVCSFEEGKIILTANRGKVEYGQLKSEQAVLKELLGKDLSYAPAGAANSASSAKQAEKSISAPPYGKFTYFASQEAKVLPALTAALKEVNKAGDMDGELRETFKKIDALSKTTPSFEVIYDEFTKVDAAVKNEAFAFQSMGLHVAAIKSQIDTLTKAANAAQSNLTISNEELQSAEDLKKAGELQAKAEKGLLPILGKLASAGKAFAELSSGGELAEVAWNSGEAVNKAMEIGEDLANLLGVDTYTKQATELAKQAAELHWDAAVKKFKLAVKQLTDLRGLKANLVGPLHLAKELYKSKGQNLPHDFDAYNKKGKFHFKTIGDLINQLKEYKESAQRTVLAANHAMNAVDKLQRDDGLGTGWMANVNEDKGIIAKMSEVMRATMNRTIHERDGSDVHIKDLQKKFAFLEKALAQVPLKG